MSLNRISAIACCIIAVCLYSCSHQPATPTPAAPAHTFSVKGALIEMNIDPAPPPAFPEHEGKAEFMSYCGICHSLRYISTQPDFPAKTWDAEITKMIVKYHAPIDSVNAKKILAYLVAVKSHPAQ